MLINVVNRLETRILNWGGFQSRHVQTAGGRVHVFDYQGGGALPPVVVLHGINSSASAFRPMLFRLRKHFSRVIAPDFLGHGNSEYPAGGLEADAMTQAFTEALHEVVDDRFVLYGNSLGGMGAIRYASANGDRVRGLMLCSPGGTPQYGDELTRFLANFRLDTNQDALHFIDKLFPKRPWFARLMAPALRQHSSRPAVLGLLDQVTPDGLLSPEELRELAMPVHLIWGRQDGLMPASHLAFFRAHLPDGHALTQPDGMGHVPHIDRPRDVARLLIDFAKDIS